MSDAPYTRAIKLWTRQSSSDDELATAFEAIHSEQRALYYQLEEAEPVQVDILAHRTKSYVRMTKSS